MYYLAPAELELGLSTATGKPPVEGMAFIFSADQIVTALASLNDDWQESLPGVTFWEQHADSATWFCAFAATEGEHVQTAPPSEGESAAIIVSGERHAATMINDADGTAARTFERYLLAGQGTPPEAPEEARA